MGLLYQCLTEEQIANLTPQEREALIVGIRHEILSNPGIKDTIQQRVNRDYNRVKPDPDGDPKQQP
jgi:hypothetical protein